MAGVYIHIPFCKSRCIYCDFYSTTANEFFDLYVSSLLREMELRGDELCGAVVETVYFGGGTPSLLQARHLEQLFEALKSSFTIADGAEITLEANPDDLTATYIAMLRRLPVNRISIGVQSFNDADLAFLKRRHNAAQAIAAIDRCRDVGFEDLSIDLMYGMPHKTWQHNLETAIALNIPHISAYNLTYEEGTPLSRSQDIERATEEQCEALYLLTHRQLSASGYVHYEISNYALRTDTCPEGAIARHNVSYWQGVPYLGLGAAAHSYNVESRSWNVADVQRYIASIRQGGIPDRETECLDARSRFNDYLVTRLRTMWGVSLSEIKNEFGEERYFRFLGKISHSRFINILKFDGDNVKLSEKKFFISDWVIRELLEL